ncbi:MAG TPA: hypothetical protein VMW04_00125 [Patescibacteria group bacterium]|nr:hypothetical protein [Patescibacteria group bacterium]
MRNTCLGLFSNPLEADKAVDELQEAGVRKEDISIVVREGITGAPPSQGTVVAKDAAGGVTAGGAIGGIAGLVIGIAAITIPGIGGLIAAGPLAVALGLIEVGGTTLAGAITGAAAGGIIGGLVGLGVPRERAEAYEEAVRKGQILLAVTVTPDTQEKVREIFRNHGASHVCNIEPK